jgi:hydrogenase nickel incorporation protein HypA/HybF
MHELGIVINIIKQMEEYMGENNLKEIKKVVLQVGQLSEIYPPYLKDAYPLAIKETKLADSLLEIEITPGIGQCEGCGFVYNLPENKNQCPCCEQKEFSIISGTEFLIKEIHAY